jgi:hypothetical protein
MRPSLSLAVCLGLGAGPFLLACSSSENADFWETPLDRSSAPSGGTSSATTGSGGVGSSNDGDVDPDGSNAAGTHASGGSSASPDGTGGAGGSADGAGSSGGTGEAPVGSAGTGAGGGTAADPVVLRADFQDRSAGTYTQDMVESDFGAAPEWNDGLDEKRAKIVADGDERFLRVTFEAREYGPTDGGVQFKVPLEKGYEELYLAYRVRFAAGFQFVKGGKLPGLVGGTAPTGCVADENGFSARGMWRTMGRAVQYLYYAAKKESCGDDFEYELDGKPFSFQRGTWHTIEHHIVLNTPGETDGVLEAWVDGKQVLSVHDMTYRAANASYEIDALYFSTFFGGSDPTWAPLTAQTLDYDDFVVSTAPITH